LASPEVGRLLEQMHVAGAATRHTSRKPGPRDLAMRELRSCYDHLAGRVAVDIAERVLVDSLRAVSNARLSPAGMGRLESIGIDLGEIGRRKRCFCRGCIDWSERRPHLAGALGAALFERVLELGWARPQPKGRALAITAAGERGFRQAFGVSTVRSR
jgi:hypothetical protein